MEGLAIVHVMLNTSWESHAFAVPARDGRAWFRAVDTSLGSPDDIAEAGEEERLDDDRYEVGPRSVVVLVAKPGVTGLWQVVGRSRTTFDEMVRLDLRYVRTRSLWRDIRILLATPRAVVGGKGAC